MLCKHLRRNHALVCPAFAKPEFFDSYGLAFRGILERGVIVPFGVGWLKVPIDPDSRVRLHECGA